MGYECKVKQASTGRRALLGAVIPVTSLGGVKTGLEEIRRYRDCSEASHVELWVEKDVGKLDARQIRIALGSLACNIHAPFVDLSLTTSDDNFASLSLARLNEALAFSEKVDANVVTVHPGKWSILESHTEACERLVERLDVLRRNSAMKISIENLKPKKSGVQRTLISNYEDFKKLLSLDSEINFTLDVGHALQAQLSPARIIRSYGSHLSNVHLHGLSEQGSSHEGVATLAEARILLGHINDLSSQIPVSLEVTNLRKQFLSLQLCMRALAVGDQPAHSAAPSE